MKSDYAQHIIDAPDANLDANVDPALSESSNVSLIFGGCEAPLCEITHATRRDLVTTLMSFTSLYDTACKTTDEDNIEDAEALRNEAIRRTRVH